jgi:hypothetical protein
MRAADSDRQFVADRLREALNEGRLDLTEYDDRLQQTYAAKTYGELDSILGDLPTVRAPERSQLATPPPAGAGTGTGPAKGQRMPSWMTATIGSWLSVSLICVVIWAASGHSSFWPIWVIGPWGAIVVARVIMAYASGDPHAYGEDEKDRSGRRRDRHRRDRHR